jgi:hypothetical protein
MGEAMLTKRKLILEAMELIEFARERIELVDW